MIEFIPGPKSAAYSAGVEITSLQSIFITSGQLPVDEEGNMPATLAVQTTQCVTNCAKVLAEKGYSLTDVVFAQVIIRDGEDFAEMNLGYIGAFGPHKPARMSFKNANPPMKGALVEIMVVAAK